MRRILSALMIGFAVLALGAPMAAAHNAEPRIALVIGNSAYARGPVANALNDAGLVAEALRSTGFEIVEAVDATQPDLVRAFRDFVGKLEAAGPETVAFVYYSGYGFSYDGENFLLAVDARLARESDIPLESVRLADLLRALEGAPVRLKTVILDAARRMPFELPGGAITPGLAATEAPENAVVAFAAGPGMVAGDGAGPYGSYATAIAEMIRAPGLDLDAALTRIRTRTHQLTQGKQTPWHESALKEAIVLVPGDAAVDAASAPPPSRAVRQSRSMREAPPDDAYALAIETDTLPAYVEFVEAYPDHAYSPRVWSLIRARREALAWQNSVEADTPEAYWTYLERYPNGIYARAAQRRLRRMSAEAAPPSGFGLVDLGVPDALPNEPVDYAYGIADAPPPPRALIEPPPPFFLALPPPRFRPGRRLLFEGDQMMPAIRIGRPIPRGVARPQFIVQPGGPGYGRPGRDPFRENWRQRYGGQGGGRPGMRPPGGSGFGRPAGPGFRQPGGPGFVQPGTPGFRQQPGTPAMVQPGGRPGLRQQGAPAFGQPGQLGQQPGTVQPGRRGQPPVVGGRPGGPPQGVIQGQGLQGQGLQGQGVRPGVGGQRIGGQGAGGQGVVQPGGRIGGPPSRQGIGGQQGIGRPQGIGGSQGTGGPQVVRPTVQPVGRPIAPQVRGVNAPPVGRAGVQPGMRPPLQPNIQRAQQPVIQRAPQQMIRQAPPAAVRAPAVGRPAASAPTGGRRCITVAGQQICK